MTEILLNIEDNISDDELPPPIPLEAQVVKPVVTIEKYKTVEETKTEEDFQEFLKQWKPPSDKRVFETPIFVLVDKIDWSIILETHDMNQIDSLLSNKFELKDKTAVINVVDGEMFHEDPFILRKAKKMLQDKLVKSLAPNRRIGSLELEILADLLKSSENFIKSKT